MAALIRTHYQLAKNSLRQNRGRSFLTCLGIAIGVASIILILSLMGSISNLVADQVKSIGADLIVIRPTTNKDTVTSIVEELTSSSQYLKSNLVLSDVATVKNVENVSAAAPIAISTNTITAGDRTINSATILGTNEDFANIQSLPIHTGAFLNEKLQENTAVVGHSIALELFGTTEPVGKTFILMGQRLIVVGVLTQVEDPINFNNVDLDNTVIVKADYLAKIGESIQVQQINVKATTTETISDTAENIKNAIKEAKSGDTNFNVSYGNAITHPAGSLFSIVSGMLTLVASISLVVGGIGVMNIMLVSVSERTHEIGVRKAVGASSSQIMMQFLFEALILSLLGGILGLILAYVLAFFVSLATPFAPYINWQILVVTICTSLIVGVIFGLYPAIKAARKNPIDSLKFYR